MTSPDDIELLIEEALTSWRPRTPSGRVLDHPAWADLPPVERSRLFDETTRMRELERALDPDGISTTARAVLRRIA